MLLLFCCDTRRGRAECLVIPVLAIVIEQRTDSWCTVMDISPPFTDTKKSGVTAGLPVHV
jgi:hypothetical protein